MNFHLANGYFLSYGGRPCLVKEALKNKEFQSSETNIIVSMTMTYDHICLKEFD